MKTDSIGKLLAEETIPYVDEHGEERLFTMALGEPIEATAGIWHCPYSYGSNGVETTERRASNGRVSAIINACNALDGLRGTLVVGAFAQ